ncbi:hypothetical protein SUGI_0491080 [Cryptomeria japonica]|nr:hypothetical protein SUGI_0491080 [Cryptomeria japonica]
MRERSTTGTNPGRLSFHPPWISNLACWRSLPLGLGNDHAPSLRPLVRRRMGSLNNGDPICKNDEEPIINNSGGLEDEAVNSQKGKHEKLSYKAVVSEQSTIVCPPSASFDGSFCRPEHMDTENGSGGSATDGDRLGPGDGSAADDLEGGGNAVGSFLSAEGLKLIRHGVCNAQESFEHLFFDREFACGVWSIFLGPSIVWNHRPGPSWSEILSGFVESFDLRMNRFWSVFSCEVLWFIWKERNGEVFQNKRRRLIEFSSKLTHFYIMSQVSAVLEISKDRFMILVREGALQIYKEDIQSVQYFKKHMDMLHPKEIEALAQYMQRLKIEDPDEPSPRTGEKGVGAQ